jgi:L-gulonate 3-dehydrogenase
MADATTQHIAIIGAGLVGTGWSIVFARAGYAVRVFDAAVTRESLLDRLSQALDAMARYSLVDDVATILSRVEVVESIEAAVTGASYIQESVAEIVEVKRQVSAEIDRFLAPDAIVGSSTSGLPASSFTEECENRARFTVAHPVNPPHLIPVVEIVPAPWTDIDTVARTRTLMDNVGQAPVVLTREIPGFILNRLQGALLEEAWSLFEQGYASAADIDRTISHGLGLRWSFMGPFETIDLNAPGGIEDYARRFGPMFAGFAVDRRTSRWSDEGIARATAERRAALPSAALEARRAWRDERLMALLASFR